MSFARGDGSYRCSFRHRFLFDQQRWFFFMKIEKTPTQKFDYFLPESLIAQMPAVPRDHSRLLVQGKDGIEHKQFFDVVDYLQAGDVLVMNDSKVFQARLRAKTRFNTLLEVVLLHGKNGKWEAMTSHGRRLKIGREVIFENGMVAKVVEKHLDRWTLTLDFSCTDVEVMKLAEECGEIPLPPYIHASQEVAKTHYQTIYANAYGSVAAPTAGLHFTPELIEKLKFKGVHIATITLHVGMGTFHPLNADFVEDHVMHEEMVEISSSAAKTINQAKQEGRRVIAVGTTCVRTLEGITKQLNTQTLPENGFSGMLNVYITEGFSFRIVDGLITNFHLPKSTLLVLVCAFAGFENVMRLYRLAITYQYRFYSFGDAMLIWRGSGRES